MEIDRRNFFGVLASPLLRKLTPPDPKAVEAPSGFGYNLEPLKWRLADDVTTVTVSAADTIPVNTWVYYEINGSGHYVASW